MQKRTQEEKKLAVKPYRIKQKVQHEYFKQLVTWLGQNRVTVLIVLGLVVALLCVFFLTLPKQNTSDPVPTTISATEPTGVNAMNESEDASTESQVMPPYLQYYVDINEQTVGYIRIDNTKINYPVMQTDDNDFYLTHNSFKEEDHAGAIFMDFRCDIDDFSKTRNIILYGHRMKNGTMFKDLVMYEDKDFFLNNRVITFDTLNGEYEWKIFAVFETTTQYYYIDTDFPVDSMWLDFLNLAHEKSMYKTYVNFYPDDIILTLSTCTTEEDGRFVVMAKLVK